MKYFVLLAGAVSAFAEVRTVTLKQALELAAQQNPDLLLARFDEIKQNQAVRVAKDPFALKVGVGSGLGYNNGFPMLEGGAPSVVQGKASASIYNRPQKLRVAQELENSRGLRHEIQGRREEVMHRVATAFLDTSRLGRLAKAAHGQIDALAQIQQAVAARVTEGRAIPVDELRARVDLERARQRVDQFVFEQDAAEASLALLLGLAADDRARPVPDAAPYAELPESEERAIALALENSPDLKRLQSAILAKSLEVQSHKAQRLPRADFVAQYGLFAKFNRYEDYFNRFQRHNGQIGVALQMPIFAGPAANAMAGQAEAEAARLRVEITNSRNRTTQAVRRAYQQIALAQKAQNLAKLTLDLAREEVSIALARLTEGRITAQELEQARVTESEKWIAFHDSQYLVERARVDLLYHAGTLQAALR